MKPQHWTILLVVIVAGCSREPERRPAPPPVSTEIPEQWTVSDRGVGPIEIGARADTLQGRVAPLGKLGECVYGRLTSLDGVMVMFVDGAVVRVDVTAGATPTTLGIALGDGERQVRERYPALRVEPHKYVDGGHYLVVDTGANRRLVFETDGSKVTRYRAGLIPQVDWVEGCS